jgi:hypothetical protein
MVMSDFIKNRFLGQEICIWLGEVAETITYDQFWMNNSAFFRGVVVDVEDDVLTLEVPEVGDIYINCDASSGNIKAIWGPDFDFKKAVKTALSNRIFGSRKYNK